MRKPTIYQIRHGYEALAQIEGQEAHFFDRKTLKFFHERMDTMTTSKTTLPDVFKVWGRFQPHYFRLIHIDGFPYFRHLGTTFPEE